MGEVAERLAGNVAPAWRWRDTHGTMWLPSEMATRHLFYTVCMIWNHSMPHHARTHEYRRYTFSRFYTREYMMTAVRLLLPVLLSRPDLTVYMRRVLDKMQDFLRGNPDLIAELRLLR